MNIDFNPEDLSDDGSLQAFEDQLRGLAPRAASFELQQPSVNLKADATSGSSTSERSSQNGRFYLSPWAWAAALLLTWAIGAGSGTIATLAWVNTSSTSNDERLSDHKDVAGEPIVETSEEGSAPPASAISDSPLLADKSRESEPTGTQNDSGNNPNVTISTQRLTGYRSGAYWGIEPLSGFEAMNMRSQRRSDAWGRYSLSRNDLQPFAGEIDSPTIAPDDLRLGVQQSGSQSHPANQRDLMRELLNSPSIQLF